MKPILTQYINLVSEKTIFLILVYIVKNELNLIHLIHWLKMNSWIARN
jgi:hypothetical protein